MWFASSFRQDQFVLRRQPQAIDIFAVSNRDLARANEKITAVDLMIGDGNAALGRRDRLGRLAPITFVVFLRTGIHPWLFLSIRRVILAIISYFRAFLSCYTCTLEWF